MEVLFQLAAQSSVRAIFAVSDEGTFSARCDIA
jgi:hypothetical protein